MSRSALFAFCAAGALVLVGVLGCGESPEPTPTPTPESANVDVGTVEPSPDTSDADYAACHERCSAKGGSESNCRTFCSGGTVEPVAEADAKAPGADSACYETCIAKGESDSVCLGFCGDAEWDKGEYGEKGGEAVAGAGEMLAFEYDGVTRHYSYHAPADLPANAPLVVFLHGYGGNAVETRYWTEMDRVADANGFAVAYPQGRGDYDGTPYWNAHIFAGIAPDTGFLSALARHLQREHGLDPERTFAAGFSNGGLMSYVLGMDAPEVFRAAASITGAPSGQVWESRASRSAAFPLLQISGLDDTIVPVDGSVDPTGGTGAPHVDDVIAHWGQANGCASSATDTLNANTTRLRRFDCAGGSEVWYYEIDNFGHEWPTVESSAGFDGAEAVWEFLGRF